MIKFQPFISPYIPNYKSCTCLLVFDKIGDTEPVVDQHCEVVRLKAKWNGEEFTCLFFVDPNTSPTIVSVDPLMAGINGVITFPDAAEPMLHDFPNVSFEQVQIAQLTATPSEEIKEELERVINEEPDIDISQEVLQLIGEYAKIENDKSMQVAFQCVKMINDLPSVTMDEFKMVQGLPCGSAKLGVFVLDKLKQKVI